MLYRALTVAAQRGNYTHFQHILLNVFSTLAPRVNTRYGINYCRILDERFSFKVLSLGVKL